MSNLINEANWKVHWRLTESAGIMIYLADYRGRRVLWEGSLPYVTVDHQHEALEVRDDPGEIHGPWWIPLGTRTLQGPVRMQSFRGGIELSAAFAAGPYHYTQLWRFHDDGRLCPWLTIFGPGVHDQHTYHPHWRFDFDINGACHDAIERFEDGRWQRVEREGWFPYSGEADEHGNVWRQIDPTGEVAPRLAALDPTGGSAPRPAGKAVGVPTPRLAALDPTGGSGPRPAALDVASRAAIYIRPHTWDDAELFAIRHHDGEWAPYSPRSASGAQTFPAAYVGEEPLDGEDVMLWYVAHIHFDQSFPYTAGPWIKVEGFG